MRGDWKWYITIAAVREWMRLTGRSGPLEDGNPDFTAAQQELGDLSLTATPAPNIRPYRPGQQVWMATAMIHDRRFRVECAVSFERRSEGALPQLVWVRQRGRGGKRSQSRKE